MAERVKSGGGRPSAYRTADGKRVPGVTTILGRFKDSGGLIHWAWEQGRDGKDYRETRDAAASAGSVCHQWIEDAIHGRPMTPFDDTDPLLLKLARTGVEAFQEWRSQVRFELLETELPLVSELHRYGGTLDALARINGRLMLLDWKSGNRVYPEHVCQVAAYRQLVRERGGESPDGALLLRVGKDFADFHSHMWPALILDEGWEAFRLMRDLYDRDALLKKAVA